MKKRCSVVFVALVALMCVVLAGCSTEYAKEEYNLDSKIASRGDHCSIMAKSETCTTHGATFKAKEFAGNTTIYECSILDDGLMNIECSLSLSSGVAKLVYVDGYDAVTTLVECTPENPSIDSVVVATDVNVGKCRIKLVGYDCKDVEAEIKFLD